MDDTTTTTETYCVKHERPEAYTPHQWEGKCRNCGEVFHFVPETADPRNERRVPGEPLESGPTWHERGRVIAEYAFSGGEYPIDPDTEAAVRACVNLLYPELRWVRMLINYADDYSPYSQHIADMAAQRYAEGNLDCPTAPTMEVFWNTLEANALKWGPADRSRYDDWLT